MLGDPIAHSLSPVLHRAGYAALGLDAWRYDAVRVPEDGLAAFLGSLDADQEWRGLSLTMPLKREVVRLLGLERASDRVALTGAANTVVLDADGPRLDNTDLPGAAAAVRERHDGPVGSVCVLGAGATAASAALAACDLGARSVRLLARDAGRAATTAEAVRRHPSRPTVEVGDLATAAVTGDLLVSTLPVVAQVPDLLARCVGVPVVLEVVYDPWPTPLAAQASDTGRVLVSGLDLLAHQAVLQLALFTGHDVPVEVLRAAGAAELVARADG